uniref:CENP-V/GFA domain-containing protein n=1 Tax=Panagrellus redivivus TaxID=6233 RepID=A0A7E4W4M6_PANRE
MTSTTSEPVEIVDHYGSCHCGAVKWRFRGPTVLNALTCNCSICTKKNNVCYAVENPNDFELLQGADNITTYEFNTKTAKHMFCKTCGVQSFYKQRVVPARTAIVVYCIDGDTVKKVNVTETFKGKDWV